MFIQQLYTSCLSEAAYFIEDAGEAVVIDPLRDIDTYVNLAKERNATIKYIFETHFHADFVSGHLELSRAANAPIVFGPNAVTNYPVYTAKDGEQFRIGSLIMEALHTPGHTLESTCYLLKDATGKNHALFTGDTLFIGDVGRPDLSSGNLSSEALAAMLYDSLYTKIIPLSDDIIVYPAHGPGSSCGKNLGPETFSTLGNQKQSNYALRATSKTDFIHAVIHGLSEAPKYFSVNAQINKEGYPALQQVLHKGLTPLNVIDFKKQAQQHNTFILDTRPATVFTQGFIPDSVSIGLEGRFAEWAGSLIPFDQSILIVADEGKEEETIIRLARVGFDKIEGYLSGGFASWQKAGEKIDMIIDVEPQELAMDIPNDASLVVLDVRKEAEYMNGHIQDALHLPLSDMADPSAMAIIEDNMNVYVHCAGGYRSVIAASLLKKQGFHNLRNVTGGWNLIKDTPGIQVEKEGSVLN